MKMGRPSKYSGELLEKAEHYLNNYEGYGDVIPSTKGLAEVLKVSKRTIHYWAKQEDKPDFLHTLEMIQNRQCLTLINKGLSGEWNASICKLMLGNHGYHSYGYTRTGKECY